MFDFDHLICFGIKVICWRFPGQPIPFAMFRALYSAEPLHIWCCNFFVSDFLVPGENSRHPWSFLNLCGGEVWSAV